MRRIQQHLAHRRGHELPQLRSADGVVVRLEHLSAPPAQVVDQRLQSSFALGRATEQLPHLLHPEGGVQMTDRMRRDGWQQYPNCIWPLRSRPEVALRIAEQTFEDDAEAGVLELPFAAREEDRLVVAELLQQRPALRVELRPILGDVVAELLAGIGRAPDRLA